jgi:predicted metal-dependent phosphoesterase TrpH
MIDLHSHTTASDGRLSPTELVRRAREAGVTKLAVTDHDTVSGLAEATTAASTLGGIEVICGIEISTSIEGKDIHVLGHFVDPEHPALRAFAAGQLHERRARMERMLEKLARMNIKVDMRDVEAAAGSDNLCRPHLARVLVERNIVRDMQDAFTKYLGDDRPAFSPHRTPSATDAIALVHAAGGVATLAHPLADGIERPQISKLRDLGLDGLEVFRPDQAAPAHQKWLDLAEELGLVPTGGSDYHADPGALGTVGLEERWFDLLRDRVGVVRAQGA